MALAEATFIEGIVFSIGIAIISSIICRILLAIPLPSLPKIIEYLSEKVKLLILFEFSAKWDPIPTMLTQNHEKILKGFMGQTTGYKKKLVKSDVVIMGETNGIEEVKYIHGVFGKGFWTFYGGHDPEDYQHRVGEDPTDLNLHPNSAGYRLILNNILFPAAKKKKQKT